MFFSLLGCYLKLGPIRLKIDIYAQAGEKFYAGAS